MIAAYGALAGLQLAGGYFASQNIKATAELNQDIADMNAEFAELDAYDAELEGYTRQARYQSVIDNTLAEQSAIMLAKDIDVNYGSAASVAEETKFMGQINLMEIQKQAEEKALGYTRQARDIRLGSAMSYAESKARAGQAMFQGIVGAAQTGLSGYRRYGYSGVEASPVDRAGGTTQYSTDYLNDPNL
jgi:hypothetical protein